ncbi:hypothetical protein Dda_1503 [Drechslerella dactyloides]|uniref:Zn(2)-C6 fungal-type domain-containing protein n=1 Tax=Drechslerella dactyloides TaxID=74499 RepID=A0AAD6NM21_DREDA|nr:hypothetical protein Dda_1503 [Drechslerella dactyloides]
MASASPMDYSISSMPKASKLEYFKCTQCRKDRQKCVPRERPWPGVKCDRCIKYGYACSANVSKSGEEPPVYRTRAMSQAHAHHASAAVSRALLPAEIYTTGPMVPGLPSTTLGDYLADPALYAATLSMSTSHITPTHTSPPPLSRSHSTYDFVQPSLLQAPTVAFDWLLSINFPNYVYEYNYLTVEDNNAIRRLYRALEKRKNSINKHNMFQMTGQVDSFYQEVAGTSQRRSSSHWDYQQTAPGAMPTNPIANQDRRGARWQSLVDTLSPEILLIDPYASNVFLSTLEHSSDDDFELAKASVCSPGSRTWEICLKLTGVHKMIVDLEEGKSNLSLEVRKWIANEIQRRVHEAIPTVYAGSSRGSAQSLHSEMGHPLE